MDSVLRWGSGFDGIGIIGRMNAQNGIAIEAGGIRAPQHREIFVIEGLCDGAQAVGTLRMAGPSVVIEASRVTYEKRRHNRETRRVRQSTGSPI
jgi:hypothetical protein